MLDDKLNVTIVENLAINKEIGEVFVPIKKQSWFMLFLCTYAIVNKTVLQ